MSTTLLGSATVVPFAAMPQEDAPGQPAALPLADGTVLLTWQAGSVTAPLLLRHYSRDLGEMLGEVVVPGATTTSRLSPALFPHGDGATLSAGGQTWTVTTDPLTVTATGTTPVFTYSGGASSFLAVDGAHVLTANQDVVVHRDGALTRHSFTDVVTSLYLGTGSTVYAAVAAYPGLDVYALDINTGARELVEHGNVEDNWLPGLGRPSVYPAISYAADNRLALHDQAGNVTAATGWPALPSRQEGFMGSVAHQGAWVAAVAYMGDPRYGVDIPRPGGVGLAHVTDTTITVTDLPTPVVDGLGATRWATAPIMAANGNTATIALSAFQSAEHSGLGQDTYGLLLWTVDLGAVDGTLAIDTLDGYWFVGTRDPSMAYELCIDTGTERLVEIVAGEESLATHDLMVSDGIDWHVAALMRPDA